MSVESSPITSGPIGLEGDPLKNGVAVDLKSNTADMAIKRATKFHLVLIKPSHYDKDGYVIQWLRGIIPSNTLAGLYGLALDCRDRKVLGDDVEMVISTYDETNRRIDIERHIRDLTAPGVTGLVAFVGVQSNQFPRAMDVARRFRDAGIAVCVGGFHISGCLAMLAEIPPDIQEAIDLGIILFAGEAEGRLGPLLSDIYNRTPKPIYNYMDDLPALEDEPTPFLPRQMIAQSLGMQASFDAGRGCPFQCSFCTIINVQGRKSRRRTPDDVERIMRANLAEGIQNFFITDDNFARNKDWEAIFDRLIELRETEGLNTTLTIQVDTLCHKIPNFIQKAQRAGVNKVFIGLESINPAALKGANKRQNRISEYRAMLQDWHDCGVITFAGYIIGFPSDTPESIARDIGIIQRELPIDILEFFILTPLPGSADHRQLHRQGVWMDPDMNKYDLNYPTTAHPNMSPVELDETYWKTWRSYYTPAHIETLMKRAHVKGISLSRVAKMALWFSGTSQIEGLHPLEGGYFRLKFRTDRRPGLKRESPVVFYPRYGWEIISKHLRALRLFLTYRRIMKRILADPASRQYMDMALAPVIEDEEESLEMFTPTEAPEAKVAAAQ